MYPLFIVILLNTVFGSPQQYSENTVADDAMDTDSIQNPVQEFESFEDDEYVEWDDEPSASDTLSDEKTLEIARMKMSLCLSNIDILLKIIEITKLAKKQNECEEDGFVIAVYTLEYARSQCFLELETLRCESKKQDLRINSIYANLGIRRSKKDSYFRTYLVILGPVNELSLKWNERYASTATDFSIAYIETSTVFYALKKKIGKIDNSAPYPLLVEGEKKLLDIRRFASSL